MKSFSGAKVKCVEDYRHPSITTNPDQIIIHVGKNDLPSKKKSAEISSDIVNLVLKLKSDTFQVLVSNLTIGNDRYR